MQCTAIFTITDNQITARHLLGHKRKNLRTCARRAGPKHITLTGNRGADYVFEAIGLTAVQEAAFQAVRPGGALVIVGVAPIDSTARFSTFEMHVREKRILGCFYGSTDTRRDFPRILDLYQAEKIKLDELISQRYRLDQINEAFEFVASANRNLKGDRMGAEPFFDGVE